MLTVVFIFCCFLLSNTVSQIVPLRFDQSIQRLYQYEKFSPEELIKEHLQYNLTPEKISEYISTTILNNKTSLCEQEFNLILTAASKEQMWAMKIIDAWGKPLPSSVLKGNVYWVGDYNECLQPMYYPTNKSYISQPFDTQYCTVTPKSSQGGVSSSSSIVLGVCVPSSCDRVGVITLIPKVFKKTNITVDNLACSVDPPNGQKGLTKGAIITITLLSLLASLVILGTIIDLLITSRLDSVANMTAHINGYDYVDGVTQPISINLPPNSRCSLDSLIDATPTTLFLAEFSALKSLRRIFTMKEKKDSESYLFINGIRVLSLFCVIIGHTIAFGLSFTSNVIDVFVWTRNIGFQFIINAVLSVDTFFVLSGFLTSVLFVRQVKNEKKLSFRLMFLYYIHRYIRLTPTFLIMILISINLTPYFGRGPFFPSQQGFELPQCRSTYWWTSILYIGNIVKPDYMCLSIAWYLHNDMQFHWIAPLTLIPFVLRRKSFAYFIASLLVFIGCGAILIILVYYPDMSPNFLDAANGGTGPTFFNQIYVTPWCRVSAYAIGILTGYCVIDVGRLFQMKKCIKFFTSVFMVLISLACIFTTYPDYILPSGLNRTVLVIYESLSRTLWSICIGWIVFLCSINQGGIVNKILSWPIWSPLARLNYSCYLVHSTVLLTIFFNQITPIYYQGHMIVNYCISYIFLSYAAAILVSIFIETPFFILEKKIFKR